MTKPAKLVQFNSYQFGHDFASSQASGVSLVAAALQAVKGFPDRKAMDKDVVTDITRGVRTFHVESRTEKRENEFVKDEKGKLIPLNVWTKNPKNRKDVPTVKLDLAATLEMTRVQLDAVDEKHLHAAYVQIREDASKAISNAWRAMAFTAERIKSGKGKSSGRGRNRGAHESVSVFLEGLAKRMKLRRAAGDLTALNEAQVVELVALIEAKYAEYQKANDAAKPTS